MRQERTKELVEADHEYCIRYTQSQSGYNKLPEPLKEKFTELIEEQKQMAAPRLVNKR